MNDFDWDGECVESCDSYTCAMRQNERPGRKSVVHAWSTTIHSEAEELVSGPDL